MAKPLCELYEWTLEAAHQPDLTSARHLTSPYLRSLRCGVVEPPHAGLQELTAKALEILRVSN